LIKVVNIITDANIGGAGIVLMNFMRNTNRDEFDHTVILPENAQLSPLLHALEIDVVEMPGIAAKSFSLGAIGTFKREFSRLQPNIVHTHASLSARIAARLWSGKCAVVHTLHCAYPLSRIRTTFPLKQISGLVNNSLSDMIIAISPAARDNLTDTGTDLRKIVTMFNGVSPVRRLSDDEKSAVKSALGISDGQFVCAIIARLVPEKGHMYVLDAAEILRDLPISFVIAGTGPSETELRETAERRGLQNCIFTGFIEDIAIVENIMDLQLNASYGTETSSLSLLEGMSLSVPAVTSDFGGNPYLIADGQNGLVVPQHDGCAIADAILKLYENPETLARMGASALVIYNERFTAEIMAANIENVYRAAAGRGDNA